MAMMTLRMGAFLLVLVLIVVTSARAQEKKELERGALPAYGSTYDEVVVESSLTVRKKDPNRVSRTKRMLLNDPYLLQRFRRQLGRKSAYPKLIFGNKAGSEYSNAAANSQILQTPFGGGSSSSGQAGAHNVYYSPQGDVSASQALAGAQSFQTNGPVSFGASSANSAAQGIKFGPSGIVGNAGFSGSQSYNLPNGQTYNFAYSNGLTFGSDGKPSISSGFSQQFSNPAAAAAA